MPRTNVLLSRTSYVLSAGGVCGASVLAMSYALSAPIDFDTPTGGVFLVGLTNTASTAPLHMELRAVWSDMNNASQATPVPMAFVSNAQAYGGSSVQAQTLMLLLSGQGIAMPVQFFAGSALRVVVMAASNVADAAAVSGQVCLWQI